MAVGFDAMTDFIVGAAPAPAVGGRGGGGGRARVSEVGFVGHSAFKTSKLLGETDLKVGNIVDEVAVQEGATLVRVGTAIFGDRS